MTSDEGKDTGGGGGSSKGRKMKVLICCFGSRGDVQPFASLARGLQDHNNKNNDPSSSSSLFEFEVLGMTNINDGVSIFESLDVKAEGVHFDMAKFIRENVGMKKAMESGNAIQFGTIMSKEFTKCYPKEFVEQWRVAKEFVPDIIISSTLTFLQASAIGQALRVPVIHGDLGMYSFLPISKQTQTELHEPSWLHKPASFVCVSGIILPFYMKNEEGDSLYGMIRSELSKGSITIPDTEHVLGQDGPGQFVREWMNPLTLGLFAISNSVLPKSKFDDLPPLYDERTVWTGNWYVPKSIQEDLASKGDPNFSAGGGSSKTKDTKQIILDFIEAQKQKIQKEGKEEEDGDRKEVQPPVYIGWGSMVAVSPEHMTRMAVKSLKLAGVSGIVLGGFAKLDIEMLLMKDGGEEEEDNKENQILYEYAKDHVLFLQSAPHDWLFPHCSCTVHHGGAGTTSAALRSGIPTIVTPCIADQFDNAALVEHSGCGVGFTKSLRNISSQELADAITKCCCTVEDVDAGSVNEDNNNNNNNKKSDSIRSNSKRIAEALGKEDGIQNAIDAIIDFVTNRLDSGEWKKELETRLEQRTKQSWGFLYACYRMMFYNHPFQE